MRQRLFTPGPVAVPDDVLQVLALQVVPHRGVEFRQLLAPVHRRLQELWGSPEPVVVLTSSGTGGIEAVMRNLCPVGSRVVVVVGGRFGEHCARIAERVGTEVVRLSVEWGQVPPPELLQQTVLHHGPVHAVWMVYSETSTGALMDVQQCAAAVREVTEAFICVDAITAVGVHPCPMEAWGFDAVIAASQKAFLLPPGLAFVGLSRRAWEFVHHHIPATIYWDLRAAYERWQEAMTAWTPAVSLIRALAYVLERYFAQGFPPHWERHKRYARAVRSALEVYGLPMFGQAGSHAVTVVELPEHLRELPRLLRERFHIEVGGGQGQLEGRVMRIGHMGAIEAADIL
ncbi:MAG: aminotransferase class V-fold PLP-dependent enzyme, partial [Candidatus Kapabacteria bacterium]|nr:aminotransferase class V-fold PLP-dependent enzyme [Candidatus Kapabacteria bacterium]MDW7997348.1 aminotransferase class V-fold PLP-dependent enzyme [Bacteroidota bacterium]